MRLYNIQYALDMGVSTILILTSNDGLTIRYQGVPNIRSLPAGGLGKDAVLSEAKLHLG